MYTYNKKFYKEYGFKVTDEPMADMSSDAEQDAYDHSYYIIFSGEGATTDIPTLKKYIEKYPDTPSFKNHLSALYEQLDMGLKAKRMALEVVNRHPDYAFGRIGLAESFIKEGNLDMANKMLGEPRNIRAFLPDTDVFHFSEFMSYHAVAGMYEMEIDNRDAAEKNLELMIEYDPDHMAAKALAVYIIKKGFEHTQKRMEADTSIEIEVDCFPTYTPEATIIAPKLHHQELDSFYLYAVEEFPEEIMTDIMQLPRETLIADLEAILEDGIRRYDYFQEKYADDFNESEQSFMVHAAYFLGALEAKESLNTLLNVFRQGFDFIDYWFADYFENHFEEPLFLLAKDQPEALKNYTLEAHQSDFPRGLALDRLVQIALHFPKKRDEIIGYIKEICDYHFAHSEDEGIIDTIFLTDLAGAPMPLREASLLDYARQIDERKWLGYMMFGDFEAIKKETNLPPEAADLKPLPLDIYEFYNGNYIKRRAEYTKFEDIKKGLNSKVSNYLTDVMIGGTSRLLRKQNDAYEYDDKPTRSRYEYQEPVVNTEPKVGRNDPCPCGSGKKYKKCCLKKAG